jgi:hypothetical protein
MGSVAKKYSTSYRNTSMLRGTPTCRAFLPRELSSAAVAELSITGEGGR